jgi:AmpD protein
MGGVRAARRRARARRRQAWQDGWHRAARQVPTPHQAPRSRRGEHVPLVVLHSISLPPGEFGGDAIERLFTGTLDCDAHPYYDGLRGLEVSAHFVVRRDGELLQFVPLQRRAWHAGRSSWRGRGACNDWSVGIELEGLEGGCFEPAQYDTLVGLLRDLSAVLPLRWVAGHEHVAPGRKADPGAGFDWASLGRRLHRRQRLPGALVKPSDDRS